MIKLKIHQLESFLHAAQTGSFRAAAELIHRSPSAVSSHVQQLEEMLEVTLLERTTRSMTLTPEGRLLLDRCVHILADLDMAAQEVYDEAISRRKRISIGISPSVARHHLLPVVSKHQQDHPEFSVEIHEAFADNLYSQIADRTTDFAIGPGIKGRLDFNVRPIIKDPIVAILPSRFKVGTVGTITLEEMARETQVCMPRGTAIRQVIEGAFKDRRLPFLARFEVMYPQGLFEMVASEAGVAMMPLMSVPPAPHTGFKIVALNASAMHREMCLITLKVRKPAPQARRLAEMFIAALKSNLRNHPGVR
jgi:DNA-binding transcriptional LysR family regulator